ncbi:MAG: OsmC family protein [Hydrogenophaga sp.]|uniref:OsmC family protein n=1 Tax=Hydrogenophaga sp. TaxID=1904254 RepID=UPI002ABA77EA|nr:OsmC family protein [Hydrogenophaga sp.]MDZ4176725.1 OsmC family protein [Hydrogenophaga sp.]
MSTTHRPFLDVNALNSTIDAVRDRPELGMVSFNMKSASKGGLTIDTQTGALTQNGVADNTRRGKFTLTSDEPLALLGTDKGVSPAEYALQALAGCYAVTLASLAAKRNIQLDKLALDLSFDIDLNGFLGIDKSVRKGAQGIRVDVTLDSDSAKREELEDLVAALATHSPIHDTLANPVPISTRLV